MTTDSGMEIIRQALKAKRMGRATLARDLQISNEALHNFAHGKGTLPLATLNALVQDMLGPHIIYDEKLDKLRPAHVAEPRSQGSGPPKITEMMVLPKYQGGPPPPQPGYGGPPKPKARRPGWAE